MIFIQDTFIKHPLFGGTSTSEIEISSVLSSFFIEILIKSL